MEGNPLERDFIRIKSFLNKFKLFNIFFSSLTITLIVIFSSLLILKSPYFYEISFIKEENSSLDFNIGKALPILSGGASSFNFDQISEVISSPIFLEKVSQKIDIDYFIEIYGSKKIIDKYAFFKSWYLKNGPSLMDNDETISIYYRNNDKILCKSVAEATFNTLEEINEKYSSENKLRLFKYLEEKIDSLETNLDQLIKDYNKIIENNSNMPLSEYNSKTQSSLLQVSVSQELLEGLYSILPTMDPELTKSNNFFRLSKSSDQAQEDQLFYLKHYILIFIISLTISIFYFWKKDQYVEMYKIFKSIIKS